jgi:uncharacterized membrane protein
MDSLIKLLSVDAPRGTRLQAAELHFRGLFPWWVALILLALLGGFVIFLYLRERARLGLFMRLLLATLRIGLFAILLFLLSRPLLLAEFEGHRPRSVVLLLDKSQSMTLHDRRLTSEDQMRVAIALAKVPPQTSLATSVVPADLPKDPSRQTLVEAVFKNDQLKLLDGMKRVGPVRTYLFGDRVQGLQEEGDQGDPLKMLLAGYHPADSKTALADAIFDILQRKDGDLPAGIVVVSDGRDNASKYSLAEAGQEAARQKVPLQIYGVGSADSGSLQLIEVVAPETLFAEDTVQIPVRYRASGLKKGTVEIAISLGGKQVARRELPVQPGDDLRETLHFVIPKGKEAEQSLKLSTTIQLKGNELFKDAMTKDVRLIDKKIKVLYIEHAARFEYKFLQAALLRDRRIDATFLLATADPKVARSGPPYLEEFPKQRDKFFDGRYNVIIVGDVAPDFIGRDGMEWIREFVANRGGLIVIAGRQHMPAKYEGTPLAEVLPAEFAMVKAKNPADDRTAEYPPTLTDVGQRTEMLSLADTPEENLKEWQKLPGFFSYTPIAKLRPGAQSLVVNPRAKMGDQPMPIFLTQYYGKGQVFFAGTDETWRWRANSENKLFTRFWGQVLYQLGLPSLLGSTSSRVQFALDRSEAILDRPGAIYVRLLDKDFNPRKDAQVEATLEHLDAKPGQERTRKVTLNSLASRDGEYQVFLAHDQPGRYELRVNNPEPTTFSFRVELPPRHELEEIGLAEKELRDLASASGGRFYREENLHELVSELKPQTTAYTLRQELILWNPLMFLAFVALITLEWLARKFSNLM